MPLVATAPTVSGTITELLSTASSVLTTVTGNELLMLFACSGVLAIGIRIVKKLIGRY